MTQINGFDEEDFFPEQPQFSSIFGEAIRHLDKAIEMIREMRKELEKI